MPYTFKGGIHIPEHKNTAHCQIEFMPSPAKVSIPMSQHIGAPCNPCVAVGDTVCIGTKIGEVAGLGAPIHSSVSGKVISIGDRTTPNGVKVKHVEIENDGLDTIDPNIKPIEKSYMDMTTEEIIGHVLDAGIVGLGGATFPTHAKIKSAIGKVDKIIINCAECEPYLTANHRLLLEYPEYVISGIKIFLKAVGVETAFIAVEDNKMDAVAKLNELLKDEKNITVKVMKTKYPQGDERQLIYALTGFELPQGKLPADAGCVIFNAETCASTYNYFKTGMPLVRRVVTIDGDCIKVPKNIYVANGTSFEDIIAFCDGLVKEPKRIVSGGPMMGIAQWDSTAPAVKGTSGLLVLSEDVIRKESLPSACIRCGRCIKNCPMHLMPSYFAMFAQAGDFDRAEKWGVMSCVECGSCTYNCPGRVQIVQLIRVAKNEIRVAQAKAKALEMAKAQQAQENKEKEEKK